MSQTSSCWDNKIIIIPCSKFLKLQQMIIKMIIMILLTLVLLFLNFLNAARSSFDMFCAPCPAPVPEAEAMKL